MSDAHSPVQRAALAGLLLALVDTKQQLGYRYAQWCTSAPTLEAATAASAMAQAELGHSRALAPVLEPFADLLPATALGDNRVATASAPGLEQPFAQWADFVAANLVIDGALSALFEAASASPYQPLQSKTRKILEEERYHVAHARGWMAKLARAGGPIQAVLSARVGELLVQTENWLAGLELDTLAAAGLLDADAATLRARLRERVQPAMAAVAS